MKLTPGRIVLYRLTQDDLEDLMDLAKDKDYQFNNPQVGETIPAMVVKILPDGTFNAKGFLDGDAMLWIKSIVEEGPDPGQWQWPVREESPADKGFTVRYSRLFGLPNFENEKLDLERTFPTGTGSFEAMQSLKKELINNHDLAKLQEQKLQRLELLRKNTLAIEGASHVNQYEIDKLEKELGSFGPGQKV